MLIFEDWVKIPNDLIPEETSLSIGDDRLSKALSIAIAVVFDFFIRHNVIESLYQNFLEECNLGENV
jgi:hypothetical protein